MTEPRDPAVQQALARFAEVAPGHAARSELLLPLLQASPFLMRFLIAHPAALGELGELPPSRDKTAWLAYLAERAPLGQSEERFARDLRLARSEAFVGLAAKEIVAGDTPTTGVALAAFAAAALEHALAYAHGLMQARYGAPLLADGTPCGAVVIALGGLGGDELSFGSEIDLVYAYAGDQGKTDGARGLGASIDLHAYHSRLFAKLTELVSDESEQGLVFRVDLDQRPEGRTGPICNSAEALEHYYESYGHDQERMAWVKARPVAGDLALGERIIASLGPFVYRRHLDYGFAEDVLALKRRIDSSSARLGQKQGFNVKLGRGGLRELEFAVLTLQLAWGGRLPDLRARDTRTALQRLSLAGLIDQAEADALASAHRFLRRIEHVLQLEEGRQTHVLPADPAKRRRIAALVLGDGGDFEAALDEHRKRVRLAFDAVVAHADSEHVANALESRVAVALDPDVDPDVRDEALAGLGFVLVELARSRLDALARRPDSPFHPMHLGSSHGALSSLGRKILLALAQTADPDAALSHIDPLLRALRHRRAALDQLDEDPRRLTALANLFGTSHYLSRLLVRSPGLIDRLVLDGKEPIVRARHEMARMFAEERAASEAGSVDVAPGSAGPSMLEQTLLAARRFHTAEVLRIGFFDLAGLVDDPAEQLSDVAEVVILGVVAAVRADLAEKMDVAPESLPELDVVALGALGARELGYASELELVFLVPDDADPALALRMSRAVVTALSVSSVEGSLYRLDTRQRPTGSQGPLSVTRARWREHHLGPAAAWEHEAMLHARVLGEVAPEVVATVAEVASHARVVLASDPTASPLAAFEGLVAEGLVPQSDAQALVESRRFLRHLDNRLAIVQEVGAESHVLLASDPAVWSVLDRDHMRRLALRMGYGETLGQGGGEAALALHKDVQRHRRVVQEIGDKLAELRRSRSIHSP